MGTRERTEAIDLWAQKSIGKQSVKMGEGEDPNIVKEVFLRRKK